MMGISVRYENIVGKIDFLRDISSEELCALVEESEVHSLAKDETLFKEGDVGESIYIVISGMLKVAKGGVTLASRSVGEYVGEMSLIESMPRSATVSAEESTVLMELSCRVFNSKLANNPHSLVAIMKTLSSRARENLRALYNGDADVLETKEQKIKFLMQEAGLTQREADVAFQICEGLNDKLIARQLNMSYYTVKDHLKKIYAKFHVNSRAQLVALMHK